MQLNSLSVFHLNKGSDYAKNRPAVDFLNSQKCFYFETCQRLIWISTEDYVGYGECCEGSPGQVFGGFASAYPDQFSRGFANEHLSQFFGGHPKPYRGQDAYRFLLRVAAGLESEIQGETDVFGQFKEAWRQFQTVTPSRVSHSQLIRQLSPWMQRIFEDTKEIRSEYLQNLGGASYGTLTRKWLKESGLPVGPVLLLGSGQIAQSIAPYLLESDLWLTNRSANNLARFHESLQACQNSARSNSTAASAPLERKNIRKLDHEAQGWREASHIIVCIPYDNAADQQRREWFQEGSADRRIMHLGGPRDQSGRWSEVSQFHCLSDLFQLQTSFTHIRSTQVRRAEKACAERAQLRSLGTSLSISHGWEDLMCFA